MGHGWLAEEEEALVAVMAARHVPAAWTGGRSQLDWGAIADDLGTGRTALAVEVRYRALAAKGTGLEPPPRFQTQMRSILEQARRCAASHLPWAEAVEEQALQSCARLEQAASIHGMHCTDGKKCKLHCIVTSRGHRPSPTGDLRVAACVLIHTLRQRGATLTFKEVAQFASQTDAAGGAQLSHAEVGKPFKPVSDLLTGLAARRFPCCDVPADAFPVEAETGDRESATAGSADAATSDAGMDMACAHSGGHLANYLGLLERVCAELEWPAWAVRIVTRILTELVASLGTSGGWSCGIMPQPATVVRWAVMGVHHVCTERSGLPALRSCCACDLSQSRLHNARMELNRLLGNSWPDKIKFMFTFDEGRALEAASAATSSSDSPPPAKRAKTDDATATVRRWRSLHDSLQRRQQTDEAQRAAGMPGMSAPEREHLCAAIASLAARLQRTRGVGK